MSNFFEVLIEFKAVIELLRNTILNRHLVKFYYESENRNKGFSNYSTYMIIPRGEILELVGVPIDQLKKGGEPRHYIIPSFQKDSI